MIRTLAIKGHSKPVIRRRLAKAGLDGLTEAYRLEELFEEGRWIANCFPPKPNSGLPLIVGILMMLWGGLVMWYTTIPQLDGYGARVVAMGLMLVVLRNSAHRNLPMRARS
jgi:hypothetical protein